EQRQAGTRTLLWVPFAKDFKRIGYGRAAPAEAGFGDLEIAAGGRAPAKDLDARILPAEHLAGLMFRHDAGDVVVHHDNLVNQSPPLGGEHADGGRTTTDAHAMFLLAVDDGRRAGLDHDRRAAIDRELDRLPVAQIEQ